MVLHNILIQPQRCKCMMLFIGKNGCHTENMFIFTPDQLFILEFVIYGAMERMLTSQTKAASLAAWTLVVCVKQELIQCMVVHFIVGHTFRREIYLIFPIVFSTVILPLYISIDTSVMFKLIRCVNYIKVISYEKSQNDREKELKYKKKNETRQFIHNFDSFHC